MFKALQKALQKTLQKFWFINQLDVITEVLSVAVVVVTLIVLFWWGAISLVLFAVDLLMLKYVVYTIVVLAFANTLRIWLRDPNKDDNNEHNNL